MSGTSIGNATSLAGTSLQATDVIPVERPGVTTPYKTRVSSLATLVNGVIDIRDYGAVEGTDCTAAIQNAINAAADTGYSVFIPPVSTYWEVTYAIRVPSNVTIFGVGERSHIKHTGTTAPAGYPGESWFPLQLFYIGNLPGQAEWIDPVLPYSPFYHLTYYGIAVAAAGTTTITFDTNAEADNFTADDVVFIKSGTTFTDALYDDVTIDEFYPPLYVQMNIVRSVGDGTLELVYPLNHDFDATSSIATEAEPYTGPDGQNIYIARNVTMRDLHLEVTDATNNSYAILCSGINLNFENIIIDHHKVGFGANGLCYSQVKNLTVNWVDDFTAGKYPIDIAHTCHNTILSGIKMDRGGINIGEPGGYITLEDFYIGYGHVFVGWKHYTTVRNGHIARFDASVSTSQSSAVNAGYTECHGNIVENVKVDGLSGEKYGFSVNGIGTILRKCHVAKASTTANAYGIAINAAARNFIVEDNVVGRYGSYGTYDYIRPLGTSYLYGRIENNLTKTSIFKLADKELTVANAAATPETLKTFSFVANQFRYKNMVKFSAYGWVSGTNDTKVITLHNSAITGDPAMATISMAAGESGAWRIEAILNSEGASASSAVRCHVTCLGPAAAIEQQQEYFGTGDLTADWDITLVGEVANASDAIYCQHWMVEPLQDQYATA